jgi:hypothetical protein
MSVETPVLGAFEATPLQRDKEITLDLSQSSASLSASGRNTAIDPDLQLGRDVLLVEGGCKGSGAVGEAFMKEAGVYVTWEFGCQ